MVHAVEIALSHYLSIPYQKFTEKIIAAKGVLSCLELKKVKEDLEEIEKIMNITDSTLHISIFEIDRWVDPDKTQDERIYFNVRDSHPNKKIVREGKQYSKRNGDDYILQRKMCFAIDKVNAIIMRNIALYSKDFPLRGEGGVF
jgi:hypothetical protein